MTKAEFRETVASLTGERGKRVIDVLKKHGYAPGGWWVILRCAAAWQNNWNCIHRVLSRPRTHAAAKRDAAKFERWFAEIEEKP